PSPQLCPSCPPRRFEHPEKPLPTASRKAHPPYLLPIPNLLHPSRYSKYIARNFQTGFLQVAVSKTLRRSIAKRSPTFSSPDRSRYSTKTSRDESAWTFSEWPPIHPEPTHAERMASAFGGRYLGGAMSALAYRSSPKAKTVCWCSADPASPLLEHRLS